MRCGCNGICHRQPYLSDALLTDRAMDRQFEIEARNLTKVFGRLRALGQIDLQVAKGEFLTIVGPNGAGKTTLIRCLAGLTKPSAGQVLLMGQDLRTGSGYLRRHIGFVSHQTLLYDELTAAENLRFYGRMYDVCRLESRVGEMLSFVGLKHRLDDPVRTFSRGMKQRLSLARALLHDPPIMLLDEPYSGLDEQAADTLRGLLRQMSETGKTTIMATHNVSRGLDRGRRLAILVEGRLVYQAHGGSLDVDGVRAVYQQLIGVGG